MEIDWFKWGIQPWIIEHPIFGVCLVIATIFVWIYTIKVITEERR